MSRTTTVTAQRPASPVKTGAGAQGEPHEPELSLFAALTTYLGYAVLVVFGHIRDFFGKLTARSRYFNTNSIPPKGYAPLLQDWENFYTRRLYHRIHDCWNRPIAGPPFSGKLAVVERFSTDGNITMQLVRKEGGVDGAAAAGAAKQQPAPADGQGGRGRAVGGFGDGLVTRRCVNLGSYNYLGFADDWEATCKAGVMAVAEAFPTAMCTSFAEGGYTQLHRELERSVARYVGKEAALVFNMGWATNALGIPALVGGKGSLIISDSLNHNSIVAGARTSGAVVRVFKHNDVAGLEALVRSAIIEGQERTHRPWRKILIAVEGIYSMEGEYCNLAGVVAVAKKYKCFVYLDEAHSIGAAGRTGRGVCEHAGVDPADVDILMGTFTKSFGAMGGYIAGSKALVAWVRRHSAGFLVDNAMSPVVAAQILTAFKVMTGEDGGTAGAEKLARLRWNANYFRSALQAMGLEVLGDPDSPVVPVLLYNPTKIAAFSRECLKRGLAVVVVGFPATPLVTSRVRFCLSAGHTKEDLDVALAGIAEVADVVRLRYRNSPYG